MAGNVDWFPRSMSEQMVLFQNVKAKLDVYESVLPLSPAQTARAVLMCDIFINSYTFSVQARAAAVAITNWRDHVLNGDPVGSPAPDPPVFIPGTMPAGAFVGVVEEFRKLVDLIKSSPGYTRAIGEDLMIVATPGTGADSNGQESTKRPALKVSTVAGYQIRIGGSLKGMDAMRVEYRVKNGEWTTAAFFTRLPGVFKVNPQTPGTAETGHVRGVFIHKNQPVGIPSADYPVTIS